MEHWNDQGLILSARPHGEGGAVVSVLTCDHGRHNGYVYGAKSSKMRGSLEAGTWVEVSWDSRVADQLGHFTIEQARNHSALFLDDPYRLAALLAACALCDAALPEREGHAGLYHGLGALIDTLQTPVWAAAYVLWEIAFLKELGFGMDLTRCAGGGDVQTLAYVSPKSGCAVSLKEGYPYRDKLLILPEFLKPAPYGTAEGRGEGEDIVRGLKMTGYFLENWVFAHHSRGVPDARLRFATIFAKKYGLAAPEDADQARVERTFYGA
ncbi:MAG: DNA repair protein RecO [Pseudobdellovibrionaceae bacterium]